MAVRVAMRVLAALPWQYNTGFGIVLPSARFKMPPNHPCLGPYARSASTIIHCSIVCVAEEKFTPTLKSRRPSAENGTR